MSYEFGVTSYKNQFQIINPKNQFQMIETIFQAWNLVHWNDIEIKWTEIYQQVRHSCESRNLYV